MEISTGNEATTYYEDIADLIRKVADLVEDGKETSNILDRNGNKVGTYQLEMEE